MELLEDGPKQPLFVFVPEAQRWWEDKGKWWGEVAAADDWDDHDGIAEDPSLVIPSSPTNIGSERECRGHVSAGVNWSGFMPRPRTQAKVIAWNWGGSCTVHSLADAVMARLWMRESDNYRKSGVDVASLTHLAAARGVLTKGGSCARSIGKLTEKYGIPLLGDVPTIGANAVQPYALNVSVRSTYLPVLQSTDPGKEEAMIRYRESLCSELGKGPVVVVIAPQTHYGKIKRRDTVYRDDKHDGMPLVTQDPITGQRIPAHHAIAAYSYNCPDGDVKELTLGYQENAEGGRPRGQIDASCILSYHAPCLARLQYSADRPAAN